MATPGTLIIGADLIAGFEDPGPPPTQADLDLIIGDATSVAVTGVIVHDTVQYATSDRTDLASLREAMRIEDVEGGAGHCMCSGDLAFVFRRGGTCPGRVTLHHGESLRWRPFFDNAPLLEPDSIVDWLRTRGLSEQAEQYDFGDDRDLDEWIAEKEAEVERWERGMPAAIEPLLPGSLNLYFDGPGVTAAMERAYPDPVERARILLEWLGHGSGDWDAYPLYELVPVQCLLELPQDVVVQAADAEPQTPALRAGADLFGRLPHDLERWLLDV